MSSGSSLTVDMEEGEMSDEEQQQQQQPASFQVPSSDPSRPPRQITLARKGRGFHANQDEDKQERYAGKSGIFETLNASHSSPAAADYPVKSVGGYIVIVTQLHPETNDDDVTDAFSDFGPITTLHLNLDRRTGYVKGYALIEYGREEEARRAVEEGDGMVVMERQVKVDWAFRRGSEGAASSGRERRRGPAGDGSSGGGGGGGRSRGVIRRDYRDLSGRDRDRDRDRGRDRGGDSGRERDRDR